MFPQQRQATVQPETLHQAAWSDIRLARGEDGPILLPDRATVAGRGASSDSARRAIASAGSSQSTGQGAVLRMRLTRKG